ncbi:MAG: AAA family ATPase [Caldilineaceae bacterium]|nr:AAA family ATPase [Caldilineaceae bacterium]
MNPKLSLFLLGEYHITIDDQPLTKLTSRKAQALLCYLAVTGRAHTRVALASLLWPDVPESNARMNLRKELTRLRRCLRPYLIVERDRVSLNLDANVWVDVRAFETWHEAVRSEQSSVDSEQSSVDNVAETLTSAGMLNEGDFLEGFYVLNAPAFEEWVLLQRGRLRELMLQGLQRLSLRLHADGQLDDAITATRRILALEPWREDAHRQLMALLAQNGQRGAALAHFELCREQLERELDVEPSTTTLALVAEIRAGTAPQTQAPQLQWALSGNRSFWQGENAGSHHNRSIDSLQSRSTQDSKILHRVTTAVEFPLIGRAREWQLVQNLWHNLQQPHFLCIGGEAGIGKTRLVEELLLLAEQAGASVARTRSHALQGQLAYGPITDWLRAAPLQSSLAQLDALWLTELIRLLPELLIEHPQLSAPAPLRESWQRKRLFDALCHGFATPNEPLLLVLDDVQWTDVDTLEWLQYLVESRERKLLVVATVRSDEIEAEHPLHRLRQQLQRQDRWTELALTPLDAAATTALATKVADATLTDDLTRRLFHDTAGNPLFVIETMRPTTKPHLMLSSPLATAQGDYAQVHMPAKMYTVIQGRLAQLSPAAQRLAQLGATIGRSFDLMLLAQAAQLDEQTVVTALDELWQRRIIDTVSATRFDFTHDRIRDVAYAEISPIQRQQLHHHVAMALAAVHGENLDNVSGQLAIHYAAAGLLDQAVDFYQRAADGARVLFAHQEAIKYRQLALAALRQLPQNTKTRQIEVDLLLALIKDETRAYGLGAPVIHQNLQAAHLLAQEVGTPSQQATILKELAGYARVRGEWMRAQELGNTFFKAAVDIGDPMMLEHAHFAIASTLMRRGALVNAHNHFTQIRLVTPGNSSQSNIGFLTRFAYCLWLLGFPVQALQHITRALELRRKYEYEQVAVPLHHYSSIALFCGDIATVDRLSAELVELTTKRHDDFSLRWGMIYRGWLLVQQGQLTDGIQIMRENADEHRARENYFYECVWRSLLAEAYILASDFDAAATEIDSTLVYAETSGDCHWNAQLLKLRGDCLRVSNAPISEVERTYHLAIDTARKQGSRSLELRTTTSLCRLWQQQGKIAEAHQLLSKIYGWFTEGFATADLVAAQELLDELKT